MIKYSYKTILFDLDGTLVNTSAGIIHCHQETLRHFNHIVPANFDFSTIIGAPLLSTYTANFGFNEKEASDALLFYRKLYAEDGINGSFLYPNIEIVLDFLISRGYSLGVATLKHKELAKKLLSNLRIDNYFNCICGMNNKDDKTKTGIIDECLFCLGANTRESVLVGDSNYDAIGTLISNIDFIAATYGFGFKKNQELSFSNLSFIIDSPIDLIKHLK